VTARLALVTSSDSDLVMVSDFAEPAPQVRTSGRTRTEAALAGHEFDTTATQARFESAIRLTAARKIRRAWRKGQLPRTPAIQAAERALREQAQTWAERAEQSDA
jgi:hypothetical protein